jgi:hypothetical protein
MRYPFAVLVIACLLDVASAQDFCESGSGRSKRTKNSGLEIVQPKSRLYRCGCHCRQSHEGG